MKQVKKTTKIKKGSNAIEEHWTPLSIPVDLNQEEIREEFNKWQDFVKEYFDAKKKLLESTSKLSLLIPIFAWIHEQEKQSKEGEANIKLMKELISSEMLPIKDKNDQLLPIGNPEEWNHHLIIDNIRCNDQWSVRKKEDMVSCYIIFSKSLEEQTLGQMKSVVDPDRWSALRHVLAYDTFIKLIDLLTLRDRTFAKLLYFGAPLNQEEVLSLKIDQIDFHTRHVNYEKGSIIYPEHVFHDLKQLIENRKKGFVFLSIRGKKLDATVPYRALKSAASKINLDPSFSLKHLADIA